jgi:hypothetical protein
VIKLVGAALVVASGTLGGMAVAGRYRRRPRELKSLGAALQMLETEIAYGANHMKRPWNRCRTLEKKAVSPLFKPGRAEPFYCFRHFRPRCGEIPWSLLPDKRFKAAGPDHFAQPGFFSGNIGPCRSN